jgi:hypothetical protein
LFYAACCAVEEGKVAEVEIDHVIENDRCEERISITVRRDVKHLVLDAGGS